jgi:tRNA 2-thiouridine synthesizing protein A
LTFWLAAELGIHADYQLDTLGLYCPEPIMLLHQQINAATSGELVEMLADDPASWRDVPKFCHFLGHQLLQAKQLDQHYSYIICKR